ncbi:hypothetical protein N0V90_002147 [Kalmusia sp. IMI 367209]|nr:hypothetical protein N0V90_002147 [Kalmusia sp. IMI 367209]
MAPLPQASAATSSSPSPEQKAPTALPGLKRGIAVGVAASMQRSFLPGPKKKSASLPPEKQWIPIPPSPVEADTRPIYELDAGQVPELPTKIHVPGAQELDAESTNDGFNDIKRRSLAMQDSVERSDVGEPRYREVPTLRISPPELSPLSSTSLLGVSPLAVSPLEEAYLPQSPRSPRSPQNWL